MYALDCLVRGTVGAFVCKYARSFHELDAPWCDWKFKSKPCAVPFHWIPIILHVSESTTRATTTTMGKKTIVIDLFRRTWLALYTNIQRVTHVKHPYWYQYWIHIRLYTYSITFTINHCNRRWLKAEIENNFLFRPTTVATVPRI